MLVYKILISACNIFAGGGPDEPPPQFILIPETGPTWTEITGVVIGALSVLVTLVIFYMKRRKNGE